MSVTSKYFFPHSRLREMPIAKVSDEDLNEICIWCGLRLPGIKSGEGVVDIGQYKTQYRFWREVKNADLDYWTYVMNDLAASIERCQRELERRAAERARQQRATQQAQQQLDAPPLFSEAERQRLIKEKILAEVQHMVDLGFRQKVKTHHPDQGGTNEAMSRVNFAKAIADRILAAVSKEIEDADKSTTDQNEKDVPF